MPNSIKKEPLLEIQNLKTYFPIKGGWFGQVINHVKAVDDISLNIRKGETLGLVGESGCGKTSLGKTIVQLNQPTAGKMIYDFGNEKKDLGELNKEEMDEARKRIQMVFQDPQSSLNPSFTIYQSMSDPLKKFGYKTRNARRKLIGDILEEVNLRREYMDRYPNEFSGGQRQRIGIARAIAIEPELVICDEAVSALDVSIQAQVLNLLQTLKEENDLTYLFISHDLSVVEYISDRIAVMYLGKIVELADADQLYKNALHPYTEALLSAIPVAKLGHEKNRIVLEGDVPSPINPPKGCSFNTRCPYVKDICRQEVPELKHHNIEGRDHHVACHVFEEERREEKVHAEA